MTKTLLAIVLLAGIAWGQENSIKVAHGWTVHVQGIPDGDLNCMLTMFEKYVINCTRIEPPPSAQFLDKHLPIVPPGSTVGKITGIGPTENYQIPERHARRLRRSVLMAGRD